MFITCRAFEAEISTNFKKTEIFTVLNVNILSLSISKYMKMIFIKTETCRIASCDNV